MTFTDKMRAYFEPKSSLDSLRITNLEEFTPDLTLFVGCIVKLEEILLTEEITQKVIYGLLLVNRIYLATVLQLYSRRFRIELGYTNQLDRLLYLSLDKLVQPQRLLLPIHLFRIMTKMLHSYVPDGTNTVRLPMITTNAFISDIKYDPVTKESYRLINSTFEYNHVPNTEHIARLLMLIRHRRDVFANSTDTDDTALRYLLKATEPNVTLRFSHPDLTARKTLEKILHHPLLAGLPECSPKELADAVDNLPNSAIPTLESALFTNSFPIDDQGLPNELLPTYRWFEDNKPFQTRHFTTVPDLSYVDVLPSATRFGKLPPTQTDCDNFKIDLPDIKIIYSRKIQFWIYVFLSF